MTTTPREGGIQYWPTDWTAQCEAKCRKTGLQCPNTCDSQIPSLLAGRAQMDERWFSIQGRPVNLCRGHYRSWHARAKRLLTLPLIDGGHLSPRNRSGYGSIIIKADRINFPDNDGIVPVKIPPAWGWVSWRGNVPEGMLDRIPHYVKPDPFLKETAGEELYSSAMFPPEVLKRCLAPSWDDCPVGTMAYSQDGKHTWEKMVDGRWKFDGQEMYCTGPGDLAVLVKLPEPATRADMWRVAADIAHGMTKEIFDENYHCVPTPTSPALARIREYLCVGGLWNPELMEHDKVRDMVMLCRDELEKLHAADTTSALSILWSCGLLPSYYDTIEKAAEGVRDLVQSLRRDLHEPPPDVQELVLAQHGVMGTACSAKDWVPGEAMRYDLHSVRGGHVFAWLSAPLPQSQVLCCVICKKPQHELFPTIKG